MHNKLFTRYMNNECTVEEITELLRHFQIAEDEKKLKELIATALDTEQIHGAYSDDEINLDSRLSNLYVRLKQDIEKEPVRNLKVRPIIRWYNVAAAIALFCCAGLGVLYLKKKDQKSKKGLVYQIRPGGNKATLVLANSEQVDLSKAKSGVLAKQGPISIDKTANGLISYSLDASGDSKSVGDNKIVVPNGGQYQVKLSDGTHIWLNSASTITYPTTFDSKTRALTITGEAYFEVAKNKNKPFIVNVNDMTIQVLGTHFNVMAYQNEPSMKTTLLEGSVKVSKRGISKMIKPGQEAQVTTDINVVKADTDETIAWTNGSFMFANSAIQPIMRKIERWYNVKVVYYGETPTRHFNGEVPRNTDIKKLLHVLEQMGGVHFKVDKNIITVSK